MPDPLGQVVIGAREIYDAVMQVSATVNRLSAQHDDLVRDLQDHEVRIRVLERSRWPLPAVSVLVSVAAVAVAIFYR
jgi:hypothetical protein